MTASFLAKAILHNPKSGNGWSSTTNDITDNSIIENVNIGLGTKKDTFTLRIPNTNNTFFNNKNGFSEDDLIRIWQKRSGIPDTGATTDLLIEGTIREVSEDLDGGKRTLLIKGFNWAEILFDNMIPVGTEGQNKTFVEVIRAILDKVKDSAPHALIGTSIRSREILWDNTNPSAKWDSSTQTFTGDSFPIISYTTNYKPLYQILEELCSEKYTDDGRYYFYIDSSSGTSKLVVTKKTEVVSSTVIDEGNTDLEINNIKISRAKDNIKNFIIYNCGNDLKGKPIENVYYDPVSIGKFGFKYKYMIEMTKDVSTDIWTDEYKANSSSFNSDASYTGDPFPTAYDYTWTTQPEKSANYKNIDPVQYNTVGSDSQFNAELVSQAESKGQWLASMFAQGTLAPAWNIDITMRWTNQFQIGTKYTVNIPSRNLINRPLRLQEIKYGEKQVTLSLIEDEGDRVIEG